MINKISIFEILIGILFALSLLFIYLLQLFLFRSFYIFISIVFYFSDLFGFINRKELSKEIKNLKCYKPKFRAKALKKLIIIQVGKLKNLITKDKK